VAAIGAAAAKALSAKQVPKHPTRIPVAPTPTVNPLTTNRVQLTQPPTYHPEKVSFAPRNAVPTMRPDLPGRPRFVAINHDQANRIADLRVFQATKARTVRGPRAPQSSGSRVAQTETVHHT
jgi:hypothetical protein